MNTKVRDSIHRCDICCLALCAICNSAWHNEATDADVMSRRTFLWAKHNKAAADRQRKAQAQAQKKKRKL